MSLAEWVLAAILAVPVSKHDRDVHPEVKRAQLETVAAAITEATEAQTKWPGAPRELAALLVVVARYESGLALHVHVGDCPRVDRPYECDRGLARGLWQQQASSTSSRAAWLALVGVDADSTRHAAREAARALVRARWQCRSLEKFYEWPELTFSAYAGRGCIGWFSGRNHRVSALRRLLAL